MSTDLHTIDLEHSMSKNLKTIIETANLDVAYTIMMKNGIRHLPVVNAGNQVVGMISDRDLQRAMVSQVSGSGSFREESCEFKPNSLVRDYMSWPVKTVPTSAPLKTIAELMIKEKLSAYLVTDNSKIVGIITTEDLLKVLIKLLDDGKGEFRAQLENIFLNPSIGQFANILSNTGV